MTPLRRPQDRSGYTLTELMVVVLIIMIVAAMALPTLLPAVANRRLGDAARMLHAELQAAQDRAVRYNKPQGVRLVADTDPIEPNVVTASRLVAIQPAPDYAEGQVLWQFDPTTLYPAPGGTGPPNALTGPLAYNSQYYPYLVVHEDKYSVIPMVGGFIPDPPTMWYFNIRQGDKIVINGNTFTVAGPFANPSNSVSNPERFVNYGPGYLSNPSNSNFEFLYLMDGVDNDGDGVVDEGFDGIDNDGDGIVDPGFNGIDDNANGVVDEWQEAYLTRSTGSITYPGIPTSNPGSPPVGGYPNEFEQEGNQLPGFPNITNPGGAGVGMDYTISRRPVPSNSARIVNLPKDVVVDMTTWNNMYPITDPRIISKPGYKERSRLPVDPYSGNVDIMFAPDGHVLNLGATANPAPQLMPFYHFWLADTTDVHAPIGTSYPTLPVDPEELPPGSSYSSSLDTLEAQRKLLTINTKTGNIVTNAIEAFSLTDPNFVYEAAEAGSDQTP